MSTLFSIVEDDSTPRFVYDDGGRAAAGYKGGAHDCVTRAIAIATEMSYDAVYDALHARMKEDIRVGSRSPRNGAPRKIYEPYLAGLGWHWVPTMHIGSGCRVHLRGNELPLDRLVVRTSRHLVAVINGVIRDTHDCSRNGTRCVYGYYRQVQK